MVDSMFIWFILCVCTRSPCCPVTPLLLFLTRLFYPETCLQLFTVIKVVPVNMPRHCSHIFHHGWQGANSAVVYTQGEVPESVRRGFFSLCFCCCGMKQKKKIQCLKCSVLVKKRNHIYFHMDNMCSYFFSRGFSSAHFSYCFFLCWLLFFLLEQEGKGLLMFSLDKNQASRRGSWNLSSNLISLSHTGCTSPLLSNQLVVWIGFPVIQSG